MNQTLTKKKPGPDPSEYEWHGRTYLGADAVAKAAGVVPNTVFYHLKKYGHLRRLGQTKMLETSIPRSPNPVSFDGRQWRSWSHFASYLGISISTLKYQMNHNLHDKIRQRIELADSGQLHDKPRRPDLSIKVWLDGEEFPSIAALAEHTGQCRVTLADRRSRRVKKGINFFMIEDGVVTFDLP